MEARRAQAGDWKALRQLRLQALADAPDAFASTLEAEVAYPDEVWRQRAEGLVAVAEQVLAEHEGAPQLLYWTTSRLARSVAGSHRHHRVNRGRAVV